jgi:TolB-like protein/Flp pilus assembly protein TadD
LASVYRFGEIEIRADERRVLRCGQALELGSRAFDLLLALLERRDRMVGRDELLSLVWPGVVVEESNLTVQISALRKALGADAVATVAGRGYRFVLPLTGNRAPETGARAADDEALAAATPEPDRPSIAVLPFEVLSEDVAIRFLADGLAEDVIAQLARVPGFLVISRASSFQFRRRGEELAAIARQLGVRYLVEGSLRRVGARLRASTQLVEADSGRVLWSGQLESEQGDASNLQEAIARGIISELEPELTRAEIMLIRRRHPDNVDAWGHYHRAVGAMALKGWNEAALAEARHEFGLALAIDPDFALAAAHRALITGLGVATGLVEAGDAECEAATRAAEHALRLEEADSQVLGYAGCALAELGQTQRGAEILHQALLLDPSNAQAHVALGATHALQGRLAPGIERMRHGMRISPRDRRLGFWGWALGMFLLRAGQVEQALAEARASTLRDTRLHLPHVLEAAALQALGRGGEAREALAAARRLRPALTLEEIAHSHGPEVRDLVSPLWPDRVARSVELSQWPHHLSES